MPESQYRFSVGPWNLGRGADPFGPPVRPAVPFDDVLDVVARLDQFKKDMAAVPDIGGKQAQLMAAELNKSIKAAAKGASKATAKGEAKAGADGAPKVFRRGESTFNRRFFETQFPSFFRVVTTEADRDLVLDVAAGENSVVASRISRISANEAHFKTTAGTETSVDFGEINSITLRHKDGKA